MSTPNSRHFETNVTFPEFELYRGFGKRTFDILLTLLTLPILLPLIGILALFVACDGGKPFVSQVRVGKNGRIYRMWKLRSTSKDAHAHPKHHRHHEQGAGRDFVDEPRLTKLGQFLRRAHIDELPQLFNVLTGDMSTVGPRPMAVPQQKLYLGEEYYELRPGITGIWQISTRPHMTLGVSAVYDSQYNRELSFANDLVIIAATVKTALRGM